MILTLMTIGGICLAISTAPAVAASGADRSARHSPDVAASGDGISRPGSDSGTHDGLPPSPGLVAAAPGDSNAAEPASPPSATSDPGKTPAGNAPASPSATGSGDNATDGTSPPKSDRPRTRPVPLERTDVVVDRAIAPDSDPARTATAELRERGRLGDEDALTPAGKPGTLGDSVLSRMRQEHRGIPVFAAEVVVTVRGERIVRIRGHPAPDIRLETTQPLHDYPETVALARARLDHDVTPEDEGTLVIFPTEDGYRMAWMGMVIIDRGLERVVLDAGTGEVLLRVPGALDGMPGVDAPGELLP